MPTEPFNYRARKWIIQELSSRFARSNQHERLNNTEWDITIILDACRWDTLNEVVPWPMESAISPASSTDQWLGVAEETEIFRDSYIATGNVKYENRKLGASDVSAAWETDWNDRLGTVLPEPTLENAAEYIENGQTPVVAHLIPPHAPYVAKVGDQWLPTQPDTDAWNHNPNREGSERTSAQVAMATGEIDMWRARESYEAAVESTWDVVSTYVGEWVADGYDVIVTADHGEAFGRVRELGLMGHPNRCHVESLVKVPFEKFVLGADIREAAETTEEKLQALGYME